MWPTILIASGAAYALKLIGYVVPQRWLDTPMSRRITALIPVALLSALIGIWTFVDGQAIGIDARVPGVIAALIALILRAPFLIVIITAAAVTGVVRALGWLP
ncbi:MAG: AzlD domain-containing protein [Actinobacteria bacterium]|nr:AzlD domain-containing protein [Actinomycetota bacterium]